MSSFSPNMQESGDQPPVSKGNPWFIKAVPHIVIISLFIELIFVHSWLNLGMAVMWIWVGNGIQKDMLVIGKERYFMLYLLMFFSLISLSAVLIEHLEQIRNWFAVFL